MASAQDRLLLFPDPCGADWDTMQPEGRGRFCSGCGKVVHEVAQHTPEEIEALLAEENGPACVRAETMPDGSARVRASDVGRRLFTVGITSTLTSVLATNAAWAAGKPGAVAAPLPTPPVKAPVGQAVIAPAKVGMGGPQAAPAPTNYPGRAFRERLHHPLPDATEIVIIHAVAAHLARAEGSIVAWPDVTGVWRVETISEVTSLAPPPPGSTGSAAPVEQPRSERTLTADEASKLRALLADRNLYSEAEESQNSTAPPIGAAEHEMEIISRTGRRKFGWAWKRTRKPGAVADIILR